MDANLKLILQWTGQALVYTTPVLVVLVVIRFYRQLARHEVRVTETQGLVLLAGALGIFGAGLAVLTLSSAVLTPLALGVIGLSLLIATYGVKLLRARL